MYLSRKLILYGSFLSCLLNLSRFRIDLMRPADIQGLSFVVLAVLFTIIVASLMMPWIISINLSAQKSIELDLIISFQHCSLFEF